MFNEVIESTPFTTLNMNWRVNGESYGNDRTFLSTLRALVEHRLGEDEPVYLAFQHAGAARHTIESIITNAVRSEAGCFGYIGVWNIEGGETPMNLASIAEHLKEECDENWKVVNKVTEFFRKAFEVICCINEKDRNAQLFVRNLDTRRMHYLQAAIPAFMPWYFKDKELSEEEMNLIRSCCDKHSSAYLAALQVIADKMDLRTVAIKSLLAGIESAAEQNRLDRVKVEILSIIDTINRHSEEIGNQLRQKQKLEIESLGLEAKLAQDSEESELLDYFLCNKRLNVKSRQGSRFDFTVCDYIVNWDEDIAERVIHNKSSVCYQHGRRISVEDMMLLLESIFLDQRIKVRVCAAYFLDVGNRADGIPHYPFGAELSDRIPNLHIQNYKCLGNYAKIICDLMVEYNYIAVVEQCVASAKSLNFADGTVMHDFMKEMYSNSTKFLELPDGKKVSPVEAIAWLKEDGNE